MSAPAVTIGIPVYNAARTLPDAVRSVFAQSFKDWELLLVDDGSTDGTVDILAAIREPRVRSVSDGVHRGLVPRLNQMIELARGTYFARMDADDLMHPDRIRKQVEHMQAHPATEVIGTAACVIDEHLRPYGIRGDRSPVESVGIRAGFIHPTVMAKTEWFRRHGYDPLYPRAEDLELWCRADASTVCAQLPEALLFYREPLLSQISKYRASCRTVRRILSRYRPAGGGRAKTALAIAQVYAKETVYVSMAAAGLSRFLIRRRNRPCTSEERALAEQTIAQIRSLELRAIATHSDLARGGN